MNKSKINYYIFPYKAGSRSASALSAALNGRVLRREGSKFVPGKNRKVINWGSSSCPYECLNGDNYVAIAGNKLDFFQYTTSSESPRADGLGLARYPQWTASQEVAQAWLSSGKGSSSEAALTPQGATGEPRFKAVVARQTLTGHSGQGIVITDRGGTLSPAPLYVEYVPKDAEYRIHVFNGEVIDVQKKVRDPVKEPLDWAVRSHSNGFIFTRQSGDGRRHADICPPDVLLQARKAMACSGLVFGGVDVLWNEKRGQAFVIEVNTAVGLEGDTPNIYAAAVRKYYES